MASTIRITLDASPAIAALHGFNQAWDASAKVLGKVKQAFELVNAAFQQVVVKTAAADEQIGAFAQSIFSSVEQATKLDAVGRRFNVTQQEMAASLKGLTNKLYEASNGSGEAVAVFDKLGIKIRDVNTGALRPATDVMFDVADRFQKLGSSSEKSALAIKLFEEGGLKLIPMLNQGSAGIKSMGSWFERLGITATESSVKMATDFSRNWRTIQIMFEGVVARLGREMMPAFVQASEAAIEFGAALIQGIDWARVVNFVGSLTEKVGILTQFAAGLIVPFAAVADLLQFGLVNAVSLLMKSMSVVATGWETVVGAAEKAARAFGKDGLADTLAEARDSLAVMSDGLDETATDIAGFSIDVHEAGVAAITSMNDVGKGAQKLGENIQKNTTDSTKSVAATTGAFADMGKVGKDTLAQTIPQAGKQTVEILRGNVEPAVKSLGTSFKETVGVFVDGGPKMVDALGQVVDTGNHGVQVFKGLGREVARSLEELGTIQSSLSNVMNFRVSRGGNAVGVTGFNYAGKRGDTPITAYRDLLKSKKGGAWGESGFGDLTHVMDMDPLLGAFAAMNGGAATDLLSGRANAITGDRFNQFVKGLANEPYNQAANDWMREQQFIRQEKRAGILASRGEGPLMGVGSAMEQAEKEITGKTKKIFQDDIPAAINATSSATSTLTLANQGLSVSMAVLAERARSMSDTVSGAVASSMRTNEQARATVRITASGGTLVGTRPGDYIGDDPARIAAAAAANNEKLDWQNRMMAGKFEGYGASGGGGRAGGFGGISSSLARIHEQMSAVAAAESQAGAATAESFDGTAGASLEGSLATAKALAATLRDVGAAAEGAAMSMSHLMPGGSWNVRPGVTTQTLPTNDPSLKYLAAGVPR